MDTNYNAEILKINDKLENKKSGYGKIFLSPDGAFAQWGGKRIKSETYMAFWRINEENHFLGCSPSGTSIDFGNEKEIKKASIFIRNTDKVRQAYICTTCDIEAKEVTDKEPFNCITDVEKQFSFFLLVTFGGGQNVTGFHFYSNTKLPISIYTYALQGNPPLSELKDFFALLFTILVYNLDDQKRYWDFLGSIIGEDD